VISEIKTSEVWARTYLLRPVVLPADLGAVMVLLPQRVTAGVSDIWTVGRNADASAKRIVAAGDSLARAAASRTERAQGAAGDELMYGADSTAARPRRHRP
jgi:hypothetical protein